MAGTGVDVKLTLDKELVGGVQRFEVYTEPPVVGLVPSRGTVKGGSYVSVLGSKFAGTALQCRFGSQKVSGSGARLVSSTLVACRVPAGQLGERVSVEISLNDGFDFSVDGREFLYGRGATVELARPSQALAGLGGQTVTVVGRHFEQTRELSCKFGLNATGLGIYMSSTMVACMVPNRGTGTASISLSNDGTTFEKSGRNLEFIGAGGVSAVTPSYGPMAGGSLVTVQGSNLGPLDGTLQCVFGERASLGRVTDQNEVVCSVP